MSSSSPSSIPSSHLDASTCATSESDSWSDDDGVHARILDTTPCTCSSYSERVFRTNTHPVALPLRLPRPQSVESFDPSQTLRLDDSLKHVPTQYILDCLTLESPRLFEGITKSDICVTEDEYDDLPTQSSVLLRYPRDTTPADHVLCITSDDSSHRLMLPIHGLVLAANCVAFDALSQSVPLPTSHIIPQDEIERLYSLRADDEQNDVVQLPLVHIHVPSMHGFTTILPYFYNTSNTSALLSSLLPLSSLAWPTSPTSQSPSVNIVMDDTPTILAARLSVLSQEELLQNAKKLNGVWRTVVALGAARDGLWKVLDLAWSVNVAALAMHESRTVE